MILGASFVVSAQAPVSELGRSQGSIQERIEAIERIVEARSRAQLDMQAQLDQLQDEVNTLRGETETHTYQLEEMLQRQRELYQEIDRRMAEVQQAPQLPSAAAVTEVAQTDNSSYSGTLSENDAYDRAVNLVLRDKRYDQAISEFESFLGNFPESSYVPNAQYWLGQLLFNKGDQDKAKQHFNALVTRYPDSNKRADGLLKLGMIAQQAQDKPSAIKYYQDLLDQYPESASAKLAAGRLASLSVDN